MENMQPTLLNFYNVKQADPGRLSQTSFLASQKSTQMDIQDQTEDLSQWQSTPFNGDNTTNFFHNQCENTQSIFNGATPTKFNTNSLPYDGMMMMKESPPKNITDYYRPLKSQNSSPLGKLGIFSQLSQGAELIQQRKPTKFDHQTSLSQWLLKNEINPFNNTWPYLPSDIMRSVMQFLNLEDNAKLALVCKYWKKCFNSIWLSYDFFSKMNSRKFNSKQLQFMFKKSSKLLHIQKIKSLVCGRKIDAFFQRTQIKTSISKDVLSKGTLFEKFSMKPVRPNHSVFLEDTQVVSICESSMFSLLYISLKSCDMLKRSSFEALAKCNNLQHLTLIKSSFLTDFDVTLILSSCRNMLQLNLSGCSALTEQTLITISQYSQRLSVLALNDNTKMTMGKLCYLINLTNLKKLSLCYSQVETENLLSLVREPRLQELELEGCKNTNNGTLYNLSSNSICNSLERLSIAKNRVFSEEAIWHLIDHCPNLKYIEYPNDLTSERIEATLSYRQATFTSTLKLQDSPYG